MLPARYYKQNASVISMVLISILSPLLQRCYGQAANYGISQSAAIQTLHSNLQQQAQAISHIHIKFTESKTGAIPKIYGGPTTYTLFCDGKNFYEQIHFLFSYTPNNITPWIHEVAFDGKTFYFGDPDRPGIHPATLTRFDIIDSTDPLFEESMMDFPYLDAAGFYAPTTIAELRTASFEPILLHYLNQSDPIRVIDNVTNVTYVFQPHPQTNENNLVYITVDPHFANAVIDRQELTELGEIISERSASDWQYYPDKNIWLPRICTVILYHPNSKAINHLSTILSYQLDHVDFDSASAVQYNLNLTYTKPLTQIIDRSTPEARANSQHQTFFTVAQTEAELRTAAERAKFETRKRLLPVIGFVVVNCVIVLSIIGFIYANKRQKPH